MTHVFRRVIGRDLPRAASAHGAWIVDTDGRRYLDAAGGAIVVNVGHGDPALLAAMAEPAKAVDYVHGTAFTTDALEAWADDLAPLNSRMRVRMAIERASPDELQELLAHALQKAGAVKLMTPELIATLADHAQGNPRALMMLAGELLEVAAHREARQIDEKLFLEITAPPVTETKAASGRRR